MIFQSASRALAKKHAFVATGAIGGWIGHSLLQSSDEASESCISRYDDHVHITYTEGHAPTHANRAARTPMVPPTSPTSLLSPALPIRIIRPNPDLEIAFDLRTRNAIYVMERLKPRHGQTLGKDHKRPNFYEEKALPEVYRSKLSHYKNSGFDRGHLAPAADFPHQTGDTYNLCNVSPQNQKMNRSIWCQLEDFTRKIADTRCTQDNSYCDVHVVTGPLWLPGAQVGPSKFQYAHLGLGQPPSLVAVPTHWFKVVAVMSADQKQIIEFACFVVPNTDPTPNKTLVDYIVHWSDLEAVTGLQFFPTLVTEDWKLSADKVTHDSVFRFRKETGPLLLTQGGKKKGSNLNFEKILHLCQGGKCQ